MLLIPQNSTEVSLGHNIYIVVPKAAQLLVSLYYHTFKANYQPEICIGVTLLNPAISKEACYASCPMHTVHTWVSSFPSPPRIVAMGLHSRASFSIFGHTMNLLHCLILKEASLLHRPGALQKMFKEGSKVW